MKTFAAILWTLFGLTLIALTLADDFEPVASTPAVEVEISSDEAFPTGPRTIDDARAEFALAALNPHFGLEDFRARVRQDRVTLNLEMGNRIAAHRLRAIHSVRPFVNGLTWLFLALLAGPVWVARRLPRGERAPALESVPYFVVATAVLLALTRFIINLVFELQELQVLAASFGSLSASAYDAALAYLIHSEDPDFLAFVGRLEDARAHFFAAPFAEEHGLAYLYNAIAQVRASGAMRTVARGFDAVSWVVDLYGPLLALATLLVTVQVVRPLVPTLARYPLDVLTDPEAPSRRRFVWQAMKRFGRELKVLFWSLLAIAVIELAAVVTVRGLALPVVGTSLRTVFAADAVAAATGHLPEAAILATNASLAFGLLATVIPVIIGAALGLSRAQRVLRERSETRRPFSAFPGLWRVLRGAVVATLPGLLAMGAALALYQLTWLNSAGALTRAWLPAPLFGPIVVGVVLWRRVPQQLWALAKVDVLHPSDTRRA